MRAITPGQARLAAVTAGADFTLLAFVATGAAVGRADGQVEASFGCGTPRLSGGTTVACVAGFAGLADVATGSAVLGVGVEIFALFEVRAPCVVGRAALAQAACLTVFASFAATTAVFWIVVGVDAGLVAPTLPFSAAVTFGADLSFFAGVSAGATVLCVLADIDAFDATTFAVGSDTDCFGVDAFLAVDIAVAVVVDAVADLRYTETAGAVGGIVRLFDRELAGGVGEVQVHVQQAAGAFFVEAVVAWNLHNLAAIAKLTVEVGVHQIQSELKAFKLRTTRHFEE